MENDSNNGQTNPLPPQPMPVPAPPSPQILQATPAPVQPVSAPAPPQAVGQPFNIKVFTLKNLLIILAVVVVYNVANNIIGLISWAIFVVSMVYAYMVVSNLKKDLSLVNTDAEKYKAVLLMAIDPLIVQAFYYYRLRKLNPQIAGEYNKLGWKVLGLEILLGIIAGILLTLVFFSKLKTNLSH